MAHWAEPEGLAVLPLPTQIQEGVEINANPLGFWILRPTDLQRDGVLDSPAVTPLTEVRAIGSVAASQTRRSFTVVTMPSSQRAPDWSGDSPSRVCGCWANHTGDGGYAPLVVAWCEAGDKAVLGIAVRAHQVERMDHVLHQAVTARPIRG